MVGEPDRVGPASPRVAGGDLPPATGRGPPWILTGTLEAQALVPSATKTLPLATTLPDSDIEIDRRCRIVNGSALWLVPFGVVTLIRPVVAPFGTVAVIRVAEFTVNDELLPLNFTAVMRP